MRSEPGWREAFTWESDADEEEEEKAEGSLPAAKRSSEPPTWAVAIVIASFALVVITGYVVARLYPHANVPVVIIAASMGVLMLLFFVASWMLSRRAANWPLARGTVLSSGTEKVTKDSDGRRSVTYAPAIEYAYRVNDVDYVSRQVKLGVTLSASQSYADGVASRYPKGAVIDVHYDPANPSNAALENPAGTRWFLLAIAAALFALAAHQAGAFS